MGTCDTCADSVELCVGNPLAKNCKMWIESTDDAMRESFLDAKYGMENPPHYYIRGTVECYSNRVIDRLIAKGGINEYDLRGCDPGSAYYIGPADNIIHRLELDSDLFKNLMLNCGWIELK